MLLIIITRFQALIVSKFLQFAPFLYLMERKFIKVMRFGGITHMTVLHEALVQ
jgi:hypothetical protein